MLLFQTHTRGKLLLTAEYFVLDGALALAIPTRLGQRLSVQQIEEGPSGSIHWESFDEKGHCWFKASFQLSAFKVLEANDKKTAERLLQIFQAIQRQNKLAWQNPPLHIQTQLDFPRQWGLGTSSTLLAALAQWQQINPYQLLWDTFGGSAYDIACADANGPILYQLLEQKPQVENCHFRPPFLQQLYLVYSGQKQDSRAGIRRYRAHANTSEVALKDISDLTKSILQSTRLSEFQQLLAQHESMISRALNLPTIQQQYFQDYWGQTKSLGAWGGDFMLATSAESPEETKSYFKKKGFADIFPFTDWLLLG